LPKKQLREHFANVKAICSVMVSIWSARLL
jgi:hypothetical protein